MRIAYCSQQCAALRYAALRYAALRCVALRCVALHCVAQCAACAALNASRCYAAHLAQLGVENARRPSAFHRGKELLHRRPVEAKQKRRRRGRVVMVTCGKAEADLWGQRTALDALGATRFELARHAPNHHLDVGELGDAPLEALPLLPLVVTEHAHPAA